MALIKNNNQKFVCKDVYLRVENNNTVFTNNCDKGSILTIPIAHGEGNYFCDAPTLHNLNENDQVAFRYCDKNGNPVQEANPNGSLENIAGIINKSGNILGMMPHPERNAETLLGNADGLKILGSIIDHFSRN